MQFFFSCSTKPKSSSSPTSHHPTANHNHMGNSTSSSSIGKKNSKSSLLTAKRTSAAPPAAQPPLQQMELAPPFKTQVPDSLHQSVIPTNPKLEALQTDKEVMHQIKEIQAKNPRLTEAGQQEVLGQSSEGGLAYSMTLAYLTQTGYYPEDLNKLNQDMVSVLPDLDPNHNSLHYFAIYDGHGKTGDACSAFAKDRVPKHLMQQPQFAEHKYEEAIKQAYLKTNTEMHNQERLGKFSDMMSGTTAISCTLVNSTLYVANVGDSRAIMGVREEGNLRAEALSIDQTPFREDERNRVKKCGARVLTMDQIEGYRDISEDQFGTEEEDDGDPPRLWCQDGAYPGTAFTRSLGDQVAERIGVFAEPEITVRTLTPQDEFLLIASDGVFEFLSSQAVVDIVSHYIDRPLEACRAVVSEAYRLWLQFEVRTDDISVIIVRFRDLKSNTATNRLTTMGASTRMLERSKSVSLRESNLKAQVEVRPVRRNLSRVKQGAVGQTHINSQELEGYVLPVYPKSAEECVRIKNAVRSNFLFRHLNDDQLDKAVNAMETILVKQDEVIIRQFDEGDKFYIADYGEYDVEVSLPQVDNPTKFDPPRRVFSYDSKHGNNPCFGELALMYSKPRAATVKASTDGRLWALERKAFRSILMKTPARRLIQVLRKVEVLKPLSKTDFQRMADLMTEVTFQNGEYVCKQGDEGDAFYILIEGKCLVTKSEFGSLAPPVVVMELTEYMYFGERSLLHDVPRAANVICQGRVKLLSIHRRDFEEVVGKIADMVDRDRHLREKKSRRQLVVGGGDVSQERKFFASLKQTQDLDALFASNSFLSGSGTVRMALFGNRAVVLKSFNKKALAEKQELALVLNELRILQLVQSRSVFVPLLAAAFQSPKALHLVLSCNNDSEVTDLARFFGKPLPVDQVKYLVLGLSNAFEFVHNALQVLYRGLVPEAVGLDRRGVVQLMDFRFSKQLLDDLRTFTLCGTPEYMSPEQVAGIGHGFEADWWSLGILAFEALVGRTPWTEQNNELGIYASIAGFSNSETLKFPAEVSDEAKEFVCAVLRADVEERLQTSVDVLGHAFVKISAEANPFENTLKDTFAGMSKGVKLDPDEMESAEESSPATLGPVESWTITDSDAAQ